jgi:hypothetical protein
LSALIEFPIKYGDGEEVSKEDFIAHRESLIELRNAALTANNFHYAVSLSHLIKLMAFIGDIK